MDARILRIAAVVWFKLCLLAAAAEPFVFLRGTNGTISHIDNEVLGSYSVAQRTLYKHDLGVLTQLDGAFVPDDPHVDLWNKDHVYYVRSESGERNLYRHDLSTGQRVKVVDSSDNFRPSSAIYGYHPQGLIASGQQNVSGFAYGPCVASPYVIGDRLYFLANWDYLDSKGGPAQPIWRVYACDKATGENIELLGHMNLGGAAHLFMTPDGNIDFTSTEDQGWRVQRWGHWTLTGDGGGFGPLLSSMGRLNEDSISVHRAVLWRRPPISDFSGAVTWSLLTEIYYDRRQWGTEAMYDWPPVFGKPFARDNPPIRNGYVRNTIVANGVVTQGGKLYQSYGFQPQGLRSIIPVTTEADWTAATVDGQHAGEAGMPAVGAGGTVYTARRINNSEQGIYRLANVPAKDDSLVDLIKVLDEPGVSEVAPQPIATWQEKYGTNPPQPSKYKRSSALPEGSPFGRIHVGSVFFREAEVDRSFAIQGGEFVGPVADARIKRLGVVVTLPRPFVSDGLFQISVRQTHGLSYMFGLGGPFPAERYTGWENAIYERLSPLTLADGTIGVPIETDGSVVADIPADVPFLFTLNDEHGRWLVVGQTWHQVRPQEDVRSCVKCHVHSKDGVGPPLDFANTLAAKLAAGNVPRLVKEAGVVTWDDDIRPILAANCTECHSGANPPKGLNLSTPAFAKLPDNRYRTGFEVGSVTSPMRALASKLYQMVDSGAMPPENRTDLSREQINLIGRWIDEGLTKRMGPNSIYAKADTLKPTLYIEYPRRGEQAVFDKIILSAWDTGAGLKAVTATIDGQAVSLLQDEHGRYLANAAGIAPLVKHTLVAEAEDLQPNISGIGGRGNVTRVVRTFTITEAPPPPTDPPPPSELDRLKALVQKLQAKIDAAVEDLTRKVE